MKGKCYNIMIRNIIFDLGNVIVKNPTIDIIRQFFKNEDDARIFSEYIFKSEFWKMMDLGKISNIEVANNIRKKKLVNVKDYTEVEEFLLNWFSKCSVNEEVMNFGKELKKQGYNIYILSNMAKATFKFFSSKYDFFDIVNGFVISANEGVKKPDKKIFEILLNRYSLEPQECLLIDDDDTNKTLEVANSMGINGRKVKANNLEDIKMLLRENNIKV